MQQLLLFNEPLEEQFERRISILEEKHDSIRKSQHARISKLQAKIEFMERELEFLKAHICKGDFLL